MRGAREPVGPFPECARGLLCPRQVYAKGGPLLLCLYTHSLEGWRPHAGQCTLSECTLTKTSVTWLGWGSLGQSEHPQMATMRTRKDSRIQTT